MFIGKPGYIEVDRERFIGKGNLAGVGGGLSREGGLGLAGLLVQVVLEVLHQRHLRGG